jgi:hypothetical protein
MTIEADIPENELALARLAGLKLVKLLHGFLSVGCVALQLENPREFFDGRNRPVMAFIEVLRCTGMKPASESSQLFGDMVQELAKSTVNFFDGLSALADWRNTDNPTNETRIADVETAYLVLLQRLEKFTVLLGMNVDYSEQCRQSAELFREARRVVIQSREAGGRQVTL